MKSKDLSVQFDFLEIDLELLENNIKEDNKTVEDVPTKKNILVDPKTTEAFKQLQTGDNHG